MAVIRRWGTDQEFIKCISATVDRIPAIPSNTQAAMAVASPQEDPLTEDLNCPICLELLDHPVTLYNCFHSFCRRCLQQSIQGARDTYRNPYSCPQCRRRFVPSDGDKVNHHLQNIVNSHRRAQERIAEVRQYEMQDLTSQSRGEAVAAAETTEKPSKAELDNLTSFLSTVDTKLQSLLTALDQSSINAGGIRKDVSGEPSEDATIESEQVQDHPRPSVEEVNRTHPPNTQEHHIDCDFEAESFGEFLERSLSGQPVRVRWDLLCMETDDVLC